MPESLNKIDVYLLSFLILFSPLVQGGTTYFPVTIIRIVSLILLLYFFLKSLNNGFFRFKRAGFDFLIFLFLLISLISVFVSSYKNISLQWIASISNYILIFYLSLNVIENRNDEKIIFQTLAAVLAFESVYGILECLIFGIERAKGTFFNPNFFGLFISAGIFALTGFLLKQRKENNNASKKLEKLFFSPFSFTVILILSFVALFLSQSRGAFIASLVGLTFISFFLLKINRKVILVLMLVGLLVLVIPNPLKTRIMNLPATDIYAFSRINIWKSSIAIIRDNPFGIGLGMYKYYFPKYNFPVKEALAFYGKRADTSHCEYLQISAEMGIAGLLVFLSGVFFFCRRGIKVIKGSDNSYEKCLYICLMGGMTALLFHAAVDSVFHEPALVVLMAVFSGIVMRKSELSLTELNLSPKKKIPFLILSVLIILSGITFAGRIYLGHYFSMNGKSLLKNGNYAEADKAFKRAIFFNPADASFYDARASLFYNRYIETKNSQFLKKASKELLLAVSLNPENALLFDHLGFVFSALASKEEGKVKYLNNSLKSYLKARELEPFNVFYRNSIGRIIFGLNHLEIAEKEFKELLTIEPNFLPARANLLEIYKRMKKDNSAKAEAERILSIYEKYKNFPFAGEYDRKFLDVNIDKVRLDVKR